MKKTAVQLATNLLRLRRRELDHKNGVKTLDKLLALLEDIPADTKDHLRAKNALLVLRNLYLMRIHTYQKAIARILEKNNR